MIAEGINDVFADDKLKRKYLEGEKITIYRSEPNGKLQPFQDTAEYTPSENSPENIINPEELKFSERKAKVRSFFGQNFKEPEYIQQKEHIIQSVLQSESKLQVNNRLMKFFSSEVTSRVYKRLAPLLKNMPGKNRCSLEDSRINEEIICQ